MRQIQHHIPCLFLIILLSNCSQKIQTSTDNVYLGQNPPGLIPEIFAPGIVSTEFHEHSSPNFTSDKNEMIYTLSCDHGHVIMYMKREKQKWSNPKPLPFSGKYSDDSHVWANDGLQLYFRSNRPVNTDEENNEYRNWVVTRTDTSWGDPKRNDFFAYSFTKTGTNYFYMKADSTGWDIFRSEPTDHYQEAERLSVNINSDHEEVTPFVAPDESYLIFASKGRSDAIGIMDLYISFKEEDGSWSDAKNMGNPINIPGHISRFPRVSPDGRFLFYWSNIKNDQTKGDSLSSVEKELQSYNPWRPENRKDGDIYWVSAEIIEKYR